MTTMTAVPRPAVEIRWLVRAQLAIPAAAIGGFALVYLAGLASAGSHAALIGGPVDPKDAIPFGDHLWNPFAWLYLAIVLAVAIGWVFAAITGVAGIAMLARPSVWAQRRARTMLLAGVTACALLLALVFHPATEDLRHWFFD